MTLKKHLNFTSSPGLSYKEYEAKVIVTSKLKYLSLIKEKLDKKRRNLFRQTCFGKWLDLSFFDHEPHMLDYILQKQCFSPSSDYDMPLLYRVEDRILHFGRPEFSLITGMRFGTLNFDSYTSGDVKFRSRVLQLKQGEKVTNLHLLAVIEDEGWFCKLSDDDAVRVCLLLVLEVVFMGRLLSMSVEEKIMRLVENIESWNAFPWGEHIWRHLYDQIMNVFQNHNWGNLEGLSKNRNYVPTYTVLCFVWAFKIWILESFDRSFHWWNKEPDVIPRALAWTRKQIFKRSDYILLFGKESKPNYDLKPTSAEHDCDWYMNFWEFYKEYIPRPFPTKELSLLKTSVYRVHISEEYDIFLGQSGPLRFIFPWCVDFEVDRRFWESLVCLDPTKQGWLLDEHIEVWVRYMWLVRPDSAKWAMVSAYFVQLLLQDSLPLWYVDGTCYKVPWNDVEQILMPINEPKKHWFVAQFEIRTGTRLPEVLQEANVFNTKGINPVTYRITFRNGDDAPKQGGIFGDCGVWAYDAAALLKATTTSAKQKGVLAEPEDAAFSRNVVVESCVVIKVVGCRHFLINLVVLRCCWIAVDDVVGTIVAIGDIVPVTNTQVKKVRRTVVIEDTEGARIKCTFWDNWAHMFTQYATNKESAGTVSFVLQLAKVKYFNNDPAVHNSLFGSRIFINNDVPALLSFKERYTSKDGYDDSQHKIELFTPEKVNITPEVFFSNTVACKVGGIRDVAPGSEVVVYAKIHRIHKEHGWCYDACKKCNRIAKLIKTAGSKGNSGNGKKTGIPVFKVIVRVIDETDSAPLVMFDTNVSKLCNGTSTYEIVNSVNRDPAEYFPEELSAIDGDEVLNTPEINAINQMSGTPKSDLHVTKFVLETPPAQAALSASASRSGSGSGKVTGKRQVIDLDDYPDVELIVPDNKKPLL
ncbi:phospholipase-like protein [Artemisia annua]|uniref:Phospholipase-like protein n=1 Tax=Artemisia annua TaxID=35608 RepID=A0A2U1MYD1_ARTAN|nr:phospholipase-like protein [Artemisia annua]